MDMDEKDEKWGISDLYFENIHDVIFDSEKEALSYCDWLNQEYLEDIYKPFAFERVTPFEIDKSLLEPKVMVTLRLEHAHYIFSCNEWLSTLSLEQIREINRNIGIDVDSMLEFYRCTYGVDKSFEDDELHLSELADICLKGGGKSYWISPEELDLWILRHYPNEWQPRGSYA